MAQLSVIYIVISEATSHLTPLTGGMKSEELPAPDFDVTFYKLTDSEQFEKDLETSLLIVDAPLIVWDDNAIYISRRPLRILAGHGEVDSKTARHYLYLKLNGQWSKRPSKGVYEEVSQVLDSASEPPLEVLIACDSPLESGIRTRWDQQSDVPIIGFSGSTNIIEIRDDLLPELKTKLLPLIASGKLDIDPGELDNLAKQKAVIIYLDKATHARLGEPAPGPNPFRDNSFQQDKIEHKFVRIPLTSVSDVIEREHPLLDQ